MPVVYPERLIPAQGYKIVEDDILMSQKDLWLIRHIESGDVKFLGNTRTVSPDCITIQSDHLRDLSNNLLGVFEVEDVYYGINQAFKEVYCSCWNGKDRCEIPAKEHYFKDEARGYYFIPVNVLLSKDIPDNEAERSFHFRILHTPTMCNYWHISIRVYENNNREVSTLDVSKGKKRRIWKMVKDYLVGIICTEISGTKSILSPAIYS